MCHACESDVGLEVVGDELGAVVGDNPWTNARESFSGPLENQFDVGLLHGFLDLPVDDEAAAAIQEYATSM